MELHSATISQQHDKNETCQRESDGKHEPTRSVRMDLEELRLAQKCNVQFKSALVQVELLK